MNNKYIDMFFTRYPVKSRRLLEIFLPAISLFLISLPFWGAFVFPTVLAYFIIFFDIWWLYKSFNFARYAAVATRKIHQAEKVDWNKKALKQENIEKLRHIVVIPNYQEKEEIMEKAIESLKNQTFNSKQIIVALAMEKREQEAKEKAERLKKKYEKHFAMFYYDLHPDLPNEVKGKSSNQAYTAKSLGKKLSQKDWFEEDLATISSVDVDTIFDPQYFAYLSYSFLKEKNRDYSFWQSANVHYNNFWDVPSATRIIAFFGSLWRTSLLVQNLKLLPNSTYTLSYKLLKSIGYWDTDVIPEDYRIFFKAFYRTKGKVEVKPIFLKTSMDSAHSDTYSKSLYSRYTQERRWAWGISDDAVYLKWWFTEKGVPFFKKTYLLFGVLLDHILWPAYWYIITISANLIVFLNPEFSKTQLGYMLPRLSGLILTICLGSLAVMIYVDYILRAKKHPKPTRIKQILFPLEFILMPITGFFLSSLPALISHLQLILGKRLEYKVTEKV